MALSPDGRLVVFAGLKGQRPQLYLRALDRAEATAILFTAVSGNLWDAARIVVQPLDVRTPAESPRRELITGGADARYVDSGHLVYMKAGTLVAVPFDVGSQQVTGAPVALIENVMQAVNAPNFGDETGAGQFAVSRSGTLLYALGGIGSIRRSSLVWVDRTGAVTPLQVVPPAPQLQPRLSPDGRKIAIDIRRGASRVTDVWVFDVARGAPTRLTLAMESHGAVWSPDSKRVAFVSSAGRVGNKMYVANADGSGQPERLTDIPGNQIAATWAAMGNAIAFLNRTPGGPLAIWVLPMNGTPRTLAKFLDPSVTLSDPEFAPDGTWMAYVSDESGPPEVYVQPYPGPGEKIRISTNVGYEPIWTRNGREILFRSSTSDGERHLYSAAIRSLSPFRFDPPRLLFKAKPGEFDSTTPIRGWDATADGQRFLMNKPIASTDTPVTELQVVLNWTDELRRRVPTK